MESISLELLSGEVGHDHGGQTHQTRGLVLLSIAPTVALLASLDAVSWRVGCNKDLVRKGGKRHSRTREKDIPRIGLLPR